MSEPLSVAVVGLGYWGPNLARNFDALPDAVLRWICDGDAERLERMRVRFPGARRTTSLDEVLADPDTDAVVLATPVPTHAPLARRVLEAGKHCFVEKPLAQSVAEAEEFFGNGEARTPAAHKILQRLADVGLGYLALGQPLTTLSGGERQRLKLATRMAEKGGVYILDEPTSGLHLADVEQLLGLLDRLVDAGKSVIVIEHHLAVMAHADWIIDLGPGAGHDGGRIVFEGTPADLVAGRATLTGEHLAAYVGAG